MKGFIPFMALTTLLFFTHCMNDDSGNSDDIDLDAELEKGSVSPEIDISPDAIEDVINAIPSPLEISSMIRESGADYSEEMLNPTENVDKYITNKRKAFNLGIYGADLGYINIYDQTSSSIVYLETVKEIADDLKIGHFFDFNTLKRLAANSANIDSLLYISTSGLEKMNQYLRQQNRGDLSVLIVTGGWLEATYIASQVFKESQNADLAERLGEQKITLDELIILLNVYKSDPYFKGLLADFEKLKEIYDQVAIKYDYKEPTTEERDGMLVIVDNTTSTIDITDEQLATITDQVANIRTKLVN